MRCDQFLPWLESDRPERVALAREHAERCASCLAAAQLLDEVRRELAAEEPLPARLRQVFLEAADSEKVDLPARTPTERNRRRWGWALAASVAAAIAWQAFWPGAAIEPPVGPERVAGDQRRVSSIVVLMIDPRAELNQLAGDLAGLRANLDEATADAHRLAAQEAVERTLGDYQRLFAVRDAR